MSLSQSQSVCVASTPVNHPKQRNRPDRCPGVLRPWLADDGALIRIRLVGGRTSKAQLSQLSGIAETYGDGRIHLTNRANLQVRAIDTDGDSIPESVTDEIAAAGLLPAPGHDRIRNIMVSPLTGRHGGRADLWPVATALDAGLTADRHYADLSGRFLFCLDDGRGDLLSRTCDLGLVAIDAEHAQLRIGSRGWGSIVPLPQAPELLLQQVRRFLDHRGSGLGVPWHIDEMPDAAGVFETAAARHPATRVTAARPPYGIISQTDGRRAVHRPIADGRLSSTAVAELPDGDVIITPWHSVLSIDCEESQR